MRPVPWSVLLNTAVWERVFASPDLPVKAVERSGVA